VIAPPPLTKTSNLYIVKRRKEREREREVEIFINDSPLLFYVVICIIYFIKILSPSSISGQCETKS
jgi:hypothetical protein